MDERDRKDRGPWGLRQSSVSAFAGEGLEMTKRTARVLQWLVAVALVALLLVVGDTSQLRRLSQEQH